MAWGRSVPYCTPTHICVTEVYLIVLLHTSAWQKCTLLYSYTHLRDRSVPYCTRTHICGTEVYLIVLLHTSAGQKCTLLYSYTHLRDRSVPYCIPTHICGTEVYLIVLLHTSAWQKCTLLYSSSFWNRSFWIRVMYKTSVSGIASSRLLIITCHKQRHLQPMPRTTPLISTMAKIMKLNAYEYSCY